MKVLPKHIPGTPGVYLMKDARGRVLYIGKAVNLKRRVSSYFLRAHDSRIEKLVSSIAAIDCEKTDTAIEALILESKLIKKYEPPFNVREKDDKSFLFVEFTKDKFPRVLLVRGRSASVGKRFGPYTSASNIRAALRILRRIFPYSTHPSGSRIGSRPCFDHQIDLCPGTCVGAISRSDYIKNIRDLRLFFDGKKKRVLRSLATEMRTAAKRMGFEKAAALRKKIFALEHIQDVALINGSEVGDTGFDTIKPPRIEGYDISNISGTSAVGSMVVFNGDMPDKDAYRKFKIRTIESADDTGMLKEVLSRRFEHEEWALPALVLVDGGRGQVNAAKRVLEERGLKIPVVGIAKGPKRKRNDLTGAVPAGFKIETLLKLRDEAHHFAISYHRTLRRVNFGK